MPTPPREWTEAEILAYIRNGVKENLGLEYKGRDALQHSDPCKAEVSKDVSAFANAAGGVIIYGIAEHPQDKHLPGKIDGGYDPNDITREWLEQVIMSNIQPRLESLGITQVPLETTFPGRVLYVVDIPQATTRAPHQANDLKYCKRLNFKREPMHDYEIRDVMRRQQGPDLHLRLATSYRPMPTAHRRPLTTRRFLGKVVLTEREGVGDTALG